MRHSALERQYQGCPWKNVKNRVIQCRKDTENMKYYQEKRPFGQDQPPVNAHVLDRPIRPYRRFPDSRRAASNTFTSHTKLSILSVKF